jgi:CelD/BcsL family acetyltransferase involved in cellulose biosynthesis
VGAREGDHFETGEWKLVDMAVLEVGGLNRRALSGASAFRVELVRDWTVAASRWSSDIRSTSFQHRRWFEAWYGAFNSASPLIAMIYDAVTHREVALVPLVHRVQGGVRLVEFADLDLTDYNAPLLGLDAPGDDAGARALCQALIAALRRLPEGADLLRMQKMPAVVGSRPNPFAALGRIGSCSLNGNLVETDDEFDTYRTSIKKMQLPRSWRVFSRYPGATFEIVDNVDEALRLLDVMDAQQHARMQCLGLPFKLNEGARAKFYRNLVANGLREGFAVMSSLKCNEGVVATVLGIRQEKTFIFLRISNAGRRWSHCSPSRLIVERTMSALHQEGVRCFDLSVGNYAFKRRFGAAPLPLTDVSIALGWRGIPYVLRDLAAQRLRRYPWLAARVGRALGKLSRDDEL